MLLHVILKCWCKQITEHLKKSFYNLYIDYIHSYFSFERIKQKTQFCGTMKTNQLLFFIISHILQKFTCMLLKFASFLDLDA